MENLKQVKDLIIQNNLMIKLDPQDAYFSVPLHVDTRKYVKFQWEGNLYEILCLCFGLSPAPTIFTELLKILIALLRRIAIRLTFYLNRILSGYSDELRHSHFVTPTLSLQYWTKFSAETPEFM